MLCQPWSLSSNNGTCNFEEKPCPARPLWMTKSLSMSAVRLVISSQLLSTLPNSLLLFPVERRTIFQVAQNGRWGSVLYIQSPFSLTQSTCECDRSTCHQAAPFSMHRRHMDPDSICLDDCDNSDSLQTGVLQVGPLAFSALLKTCE